MTTLTGVNDYIVTRAMAFSPNGEFLAVKGGTRVLIWETRNWQKPFDEFEGEPNRHENHNDAITFSPESR